MFMAGSRFVARDADRIDRMNVFPVPDGDTGSNLAATLARMETELPDGADTTVPAIAEAAAKGALLGARGNSGVIFSQILRGFADGIGDHPTVSTGDLARAFVLAADRAYQAVIRPVEGTILTVVNDTAAAAALSAVEHEDFESVLSDALDQARLTLARTPQMLDKLRQAGVVDAGGQGFVTFLEGMLAAARGADIDATAPSETSAHETGAFQYCTEIVVAAPENSASDFRSRLSSEGDSLIVAADGGVTKIHIHTNNPSAVLSMAIAAGELVEVKIENMKRQHSERFIPAQRVTSSAPVQPSSPVVEPAMASSACAAVLAVVSGDGLQRIFRSLGASIVDGGQSMNPSTEMLLEAVNRISMEPIFILPNNGNIALAAGKAAEVSGRRVRVIPSETIPQGIAAMMELEGVDDPDEAAERMNAAIDKVTTVEITQAVRDATLDGLRILEGHYIAVVDGLVMHAERDLSDILGKTVATLAERNLECVTFFFGAGLTETQAKALTDPLSSKYTDIEFELREGGQPLYHFIISAE